MKLTLYHHLETVDIFVTLYGFFATESVNRGLQFEPHFEMGQTYFPVFTGSGPEEQ